MDYKAVNEVLGELRVLRQKNNLVERIVVNEINGDEGSQGEENEIYEVYKTQIEGVFVKLKIASDSYGDNEFVDGIQFVRPTEKVVTSYEPVK